MENHIKHIKDGKVAVVLSLHWQTWPIGSLKQQEFMVLNTNVVNCALKEKYGEAADLINKMFPEDKGGAFVHSQKLRVEWVEEGRQFYIEYDNERCREYLSYSIPVIFKA